MVVLLGLAVLTVLQGLELQFREVDVVGAKIAVPFNTISPGKDITIMFIAEKNKLRFLLNTALTIVKYSEMTAFTAICLDCTEEDNAEWTSKGIHIIESKALFDLSLFAFRSTGPMSHTQVLAAGDKRRHSVHMYYREWVKFILLEHKLSVFLVDIDVCMKSSIGLFMKPEDVVVSATWPKNNRPGAYSFPFITKEHNVLVELNNGLALFTPSPGYMRFQREFMGFQVHEVVADYGFAQTAFSKLMHMTNLSLATENQFELTGKNDYGITVRAVKIGYHPAGVSDWLQKEHKMRAHADCWMLPQDWGGLWNTTTNIKSLLETVEGAAKDPRHGSKEGSGAEQV